MWAPLNRRETVLPHASPSSKKRKPAKIGCSSFEEAQHLVASDRWFRWSCVVFVSFARWCVFCRHAVVRLWRSAFVDLLGDAWRCELVPDFFVRTSQGARLLLLDASQGHPRSTRDGCERVTGLADGRQRGVFMAMVHTCCVSVAPSFLVPLLSFLFAQSCVGGEENVTSRSCGELLLVSQHDMATGERAATENAWMLHGHQRGCVLACRLHETGYGPLPNTRGRKHRAHECARYAHGRRSFEGVGKGSMSAAETSRGRWVRRNVDETLRNVIFDARQILFMADFLVCGMNSRSLQAT